MWFFLDVVTRRLISILSVRFLFAMGVNRGDCSGELCRVVLLGDARVGKSALVARAVYDKFSEVGQLEINCNTL